MQSDKVLNLPAGYFGIVLGTIGMGFAWRYASQVWQVSHWLGDGLVILAMIIWGLLTSAFIARLIRFPHSVLAEVRHPVLSSFVSLFPATTMLVAIGFVPWFRPLAVCLFSFGVVVQLAYAAWQTAGLWRGSIFQSNLGNETQTRSHGNASREAFEQALGCPVLDEFQLYQEAEERSKRRCGLL